MNEQTYEQQLDRMLAELSVSKRLFGYPMLRRAVLLVAERPALIGAVTKELYPLVAAEFGMVPHQVEGAIRRALVSAWEKGDTMVQKVYFDHTISAKRGRPQMPNSLQTWPSGCAAGACFEPL